MVNENKSSVAVVGAGPGGYAAAFLASDLGLNVTLIDPEDNPGGVCLYRGCIPSKILLHLVKIIQMAREADALGIHYDEPRLELDKIRSSKEQIVQQVTSGLGFLSKKRKIKYLQGKASFLDSNTLQIKLNAGKEEKQSFDHIILATGSEAVSLPNIKLQSSKIWNSTDALNLKNIPSSLLVVGGGYIGLELGTVYSQLGSKVTVVEMMPGILPGVDRDLVGIYTKHSERYFENILVKTKVANIQEESHSLKVAFDPESGQANEGNYEAVLVSIGREPITNDIGLENTKIEFTEKGYIKVNEQRQTDDSVIYAIGDITGPPLLAHKATHEGRVAAEAIAGQKSAFEPAAIPAVEYTDPEIAYCGLSETQAKENQQKIEVAKFPWGASGRAATLGRTEGLTKLIIDPKSERILGVGIVGQDAGELIAEGALALEMAAVAKDLGMTIHPHPTLSETLMEAAEVFYGQSTHYFRSKRKKR